LFPSRDRELGFMNLTSEHDGWMNQRAEYQRQAFISKVIVRTHADIQRSDRSTWTTKLVGN